MTKRKTPEPKRRTTSEINRWVKGLSAAQIQKLYRGLSPPARCPECVHSEEKIATLTRQLEEARKERDEVQEKLAKEHVNCLRAVRADLASVQAQNDAARAKLTWCCEFYCDWYDGKENQDLSAASVIYEIVSTIRVILSSAPDTKERKP